MFKKAFFIVVPIILVIVLIFLFGINTYNSKYEVFQSDGHIIAKNSKSTTEKYFFDTETKYKTVDDNVYITTKDNETITVPTESFIHYADGSISTFTKTVVLDLDDLNKDVYKYYNIFSETIFVKNGSTYSVNYLDKKLNFNNFLLKINNDKYMIIGQKMTLKIGATEKKIENNYLEISYLDGNVIKIENQSVAYQSVDDEVLLELDNGITIDLSLRNIYKDKERKVAMGEITVDSDDNIQINAEDNKSITGEKEKNESEDETGGGKGSSKGGNGESNGGEDSKPQLPDVNSGVVDTTVDSIEQIIDENARIKDAEFKIVDMDVTANRLRATVQVTDEAAVLTGVVNVKIVEYNTNKIVYEVNDDSGSNVIDIENEALTPETNYVLVLNSDYKKNNVTYNKDFIQKTFITDAIGISVNKYFVSEKELQVDVKKGSYSDVVSVDLALMDNNDKVLKTITVPLNDEDNVVSFAGLVHNNTYKVRAYNFVYKDSIISDGFTIIKSFQTLKTKPSIGSTAYSIDKKEGKFNMMINNNSDPDGGIVNYRYEVYDARVVNNDGILPVSVIEKGSNSSAALTVDGKTIERGVPYIFRTVMIFNDNEKEYEYVSEFSDVMKLDGVQFPTVRFTKNEVTFERIIGEIEIIDDGNTIDINGGTIITVTYTDSIGNSRSFTSSGSLKIPVDVNNLRSNETYSFAVSARVNLQDGNPAIDSCYIGSVIVKTEDPHPFVAEFNKVEDSATAFSVDARLIPSNGNDTELEANTLTGISFNIYSGTGTSGALIKTIKSVDKDLDAYSSELRSKYYDNTFRLNPAFFGLTNGDFTSEYYTIEITSAYDYTTYKNNLPIENNIYTVKTQASLPDLPSDPDNAVEYIPIRNRDLSDDKKRDDLDDSTIVGYKFRATYDNTRKYAINIHYFIKDMNDNVISTIEYKVPATGDIDYSTFYIKDGLEIGVTDDDVHRGQKFYISYTADLDTDYDGVTNSVYPPTGILRSTTISPPRQEPKFKFYPSVSTETSYSWKYLYSDIDHALLDRKVYSHIDGIETDSAILTQDTQYQSIDFAVNKAGIFSIYAKYVYTDGTTPKQALLSSHYYEGVATVDFGKIALYPDKNRVIFSFLDFDSKPEIFEKVSDVKIEFISGDNSVVVDGLSLKNSNITVNYSLIESLEGKNITPRVTIYYDSGIYGFDNVGDAFAIQQLRGSLEEYVYYYTFGGNKFTTRDTADGSYVTYNLKVADNLLSINDKLTNKSSEYPIFISSYGVAYNSSYISPKKLYTSEGVYSDVSSFRFDTIIPGVSIFNEEGKTTISPLINTASVVLTTYGVENKLRDDKIYVELYQSEDDTATNVTMLDTFEYNLSELNKAIEFTDLLPETNYYFKVYGYIVDNGEYKKTYLYDVDQQRDGVNYYFKTIGNVGIDKMTVKYSADSYSKRQLKLTYHLSQTIGYTYIKYNVYRRYVDLEGDVNYELLENVTTTNDVFFKQSMTKYIDIPNDSGFVTGNTYVIEVQPVLTTKINGVTTDVNLQKAATLYSFKKLYKPYFSVYQSAVSNTISYRVNVRDYNKTIVDGLYQIQILDSNGNDVTPDEYKSKNYSISTTNKVFELNNAISNQKYTFNIKYGLDIYNDASRITNVVYSVNSNVVSGSEISVGSVYASTDKVDNTKVNLSFFDSVKLTDAKVLRYSIYDENSFSIDNEVEFKPSLSQSGDTTFYIFQLPETISTSGIYYISMQFLDDDGAILAEETVEYRFL